MSTPEQALTAYRNRIARVGTRIEWFDRQVSQGLRITMQGRLDMAAQLLRDKIVANISLPVDRDDAGNVIQRSVRGEFPRSESTRLMKDIFWDRSDKRGKLVRIIGTSLDYGLWLEVSENLNRSFLRRTFDEHRQTIERMLTRRVN